MVVTALAIIVWGQSNRWHVWPISTYQFFPVLGLVAFSLMWSHYVAGGVARYLKLNPTILRSYYTSTGWIVLVLICLHPSLLIYQRFRDGAGLPPHSYESYVLPGLGWVTLVGTASLLVFLAYELKRFYEDRAGWRYILYLVDVAMLGIFYHGLRLGTQIQQGWFRTVWWFYGVSLVGLLTYKYLYKLKTRS